jgi:hypothetical protein
LYRYWNSILVAYVGYAALKQIEGHCFLCSLHVPDTSLLDSSGLLYIHLTGFACEFVYSARIAVLGATASIWYCVSAECDTYVGVFEEIGNFSYFRSMLSKDCPFFLSVFVLLPVICF